MPFASFTRQQLRQPVTSEIDFEVQSYDFYLTNNAPSTYYFTIQGDKYSGNSDILNQVFVSSANNCKVIHGNTSLGVAVEPNSVGSFKLIPTSFIPKEKIKFSSSNSLIYNINDRTSSGSFYGVELFYETVVDELITENGNELVTENNLRISI